LQQKTGQILTVLPAVPGELVHGHATSFVSIPSPIPGNVRVAGALRLHSEKRRECAARQNVMMVLASAYAHEGATIALRLNFS
jgi:hypothetical protein